MKKIISLICLLTFISVQPVWATIKVPAGIVIPVTLNNKETSKTLSSGSTIEAIIADDVKVQNNIIFKKGDNAILYVIKAKKAGFVGIPGELLISGGKVYDTKGHEHRFDFNREIIGEEKTWPKVCVGCGVFIILAPLALFGFVKGGQAEIYKTSILEVTLSSEFLY